MTSKYLPYEKACAYISMFCTKTGKEVLTKSAFEANYKDIKAYMTEALNHDPNDKGIDDDAVIEATLAAKNFVNKTTTNSGLKAEDIAKGVKSTLNQGRYLASINFTPNNGEGEQTGHCFSFKVDGSGKNKTVKVIGNNDGASVQYQAQRGFTRTITIYA